MTPQSEQAYRTDLAMWYKDRESQRQHINKLRRIEENIAIQKDNYGRPLKEIKSVKTWSIINLLKYLLP